MLEQAEMPAESVTLEQLVHRRIHHRTGGQVRQLRVVVADGQVVIAGQTRCYYHKQLVLAAALEVLNARSVEIALNIDVD